MKIIFLLLFKLIVNSILKTECVISSICQDGTQCSDNGNCYINITEYYSDKNKYTTCICNDGWTTLNNEVTKCCYFRKSQISAFLLEFFIGFGSGHFYLGNSNFGIGKLLISIFICLVFYVSIIISCMKNDEYDLANSKSSNIRNLIIITFMSYFILQISDLIFFGINFYKDLNNEQLTSW